MIESITSSWYECQIATEKMNADGVVKKVTELYAVDALTFTEAEGRIIDEQQPYTLGEFQVKNINPAQYKEVFFSGLDKDDRWFKVKVACVIYENVAKEKTMYTYYLVQADKAETANAYVKEVMGRGMSDYRIVSNVETKIIDVFKH